MKANELMTGDWVVWATRSTKIDAIAEGGFSVHLKDEGWQSVDAVEPIKLTPEILEKNGFKNTSAIIVGTPKMRWASEDGRTEITIWIDDTIPMEIRKNVYYEDEESYTLPFPGCVHELQHAFRLCRIKKEIEL